MRTLNEARQIELGFPHHLYTTKMVRAEAYGALHRTTRGSTLLVWVEDVVLVVRTPVRG